MPEIEAPPAAPAEPPAPPVEGQPPAGDAPPAPPADTPPAPTPEVPLVPETYDLKLPDGSTLDPAIVQRAAARARELGLSNEAGQKLLDQTVQDLTESETKAEADAQAFAEAWKPGGAEWMKRDEKWRGEALADSEIGGSSEKLATSVEQAQRALTKYGAEFKAYLDDTGLGSHPAAIKFLARIGKAMGEGELVQGSPSAAKPRNDAQTMYPSHYNDDGSTKPAG